MWMEVWYPYNPWRENLSVVPKMQFRPIPNGLYLLLPWIWTKLPRPDSTFSSRSRYSATANQISKSTHPFINKRFFVLLFVVFHCRLHLFIHKRFDIGIYVIKPDVRVKNLIFMHKSIGTMTATHPQHKTHDHNQLVQPDMRKPIMNCLPYQCIYVCYCLINLSEYGHVEI